MIKIQYKDHALVHWKYIGHTDFYFVNSEFAEKPNSFQILVTQLGFKILIFSFLIC